MSKVKWRKCPYGSYVIGRCPVLGRVSPLSSDGIWWNWWAMEGTSDIAPSLEEAKRAVEQRLDNLCEIIQKALGKEGK